MSSEALEDVMQGSFGKWSLLRKSSKVQKGRSRFWGKGTVLFDAHPITPWFFPTVASQCGTWPVSAGRAEESFFQVRDGWCLGQVMDVLERLDSM